jgi:hypothetical protein
MLGACNGIIIVDVFDKEKKYYNTENNNQIKKPSRDPSSICF